MYPGQIILLSARVREGHILKAKFRLGGQAGGKAGARGSCPHPPAGAAHGLFVAGKLGQGFRKYAQKIL